MRLVAQARLGYYPAPDDAVTAILRHLRVPEGKADEIVLLDPCAGEGRAIAQLATSLGMSPDRVYVVELDAGRVQECRTNLPGANVLGPASFLGTQVTAASFGAVYCNAPFDQTLSGGGREEFVFTQRATRLLVPNGILVLIAPEPAVIGNRDFIRFLDANYEQLRVFQFPPECRKYREIVVLGRRRRTELPMDEVYRHGELHKCGFQWRGYGQERYLTVIGSDQYNRVVEGQAAEQESCPVYEIPQSLKPNAFRKIAYAPGELETALAKSPLQRLLKEVTIPPPQRPPLPLNKGHVALLLASGMLDGLVESPGGNHVVRGTAQKYEFVSERSATENEDTGAVTEKVVFSQKITLTIRAVGPDGVIHSFSDQPQDQPADAESAPPESDTTAGAA